VFARGFGEVHGTISGDRGTISGDRGTISDPPGITGETREGKEFGASFGTCFDSGDPGIRESGGLESGQ
jgi:hypothetical protein